MRECFEERFLNASLSLSLLYSSFCVSLCVVEVRERELEELEEEEDVASRHVNVQA